MWSKERFAYIPKSKNVVRLCARRVGGGPRLRAWRLPGPPRPKAWRARTGGDGYCKFVGASSLSNSLAFGKFTCLICLPLPFRVPNSNNAAPQVRRAPMQNVKRGCRKDFWKKKQEVNFRMPVRHVASAECSSGHRSAHVNNSARQPNASNAGGQAAQIPTPNTRHASNAPGSNPTKFTARQSHATTCAKTVMPICWRSHLLRQTLLPGPWIIANIFVWGRRDKISDLRIWRNNLKYWPNRYYENRRFGNCAQRGALPPPKIDVSE